MLTTSLGQPRSEHLQQDPDESTLIETKNAPLIGIQGAQLLPFSGFLFARWRVR